MYYDCIMFMFYKQDVILFGEERRGEERLGLKNVKFSSCRN